MLARFRPSVDGRLLQSHPLAVRPRSARRGHVTGLTVAELRRYAGQAGPPPRDIDVLVVGKIDRADLYEAADRAKARLGIEVNPVVRTLRQWNEPEDALVTQIKASAHAVLGPREGMKP